MCERVRGGREDKREGRGDEDRKGKLCAPEQVWRSEDNFVESVLSFHLYAGSGDQNSIIKLAQQTSLSTKPSCWPL